jgi:hypothetical protein
MTGSILGEPEKIRILRSKLMEAEGLLKAF